MLPSSVRRVVAAASPQSPAAVPRAAIAYLPAKAFHQRRCSSSKPSSPDDGPRDIAARPSVPASRGSKTGEKTKGQAKEAAPQPPSVPSTRHIGDEGLALSTFFALYRPISVTQLLPKTVSDDAFAKIFTSRTRGSKVAEVLSTLSKTVHDLEEPMSRLSVGNGNKKPSNEAHEAEDGSARVSLKHSDGSETSVYIQLNAVSDQYLPYTPPPAPEPFTAAEAEATESANGAPAAAEEPAEQAPQTRIYKAMVTIEETVDANGQYKVVAHSPELVEEDARPRSFLERMALRQLRYDEVRRQQDRTMQAISVRRIRKLKMKKKKYKKLMKRTRNIRRKLDRL